MAEKKPTENELFEKAKKLKEELSALSAEIQRFEENSDHDRYSEEEERQKFVELCENSILLNERKTAILETARENDWRAIIDFLN